MEEQLWKELLRGVLLKGLTELGLSRKEGKAFLKEMARRGLLEEEEWEDIYEEVFFQKASRPREEWEKRLKEGVRETLEEMGVISQRDVLELNCTLELLLQKLDEKGQ